MKEQLFPTDEQIDRVVQQFNAADPLYNLREFGDISYNVYTINEAAVDILLDDGFMLKDLFWKRDSLAEAAVKRVNGYERIVRMRQTLRSELNKYVSFASEPMPVDLQR